jgi:poly(3-hydroxybutyrate) depolymerase
LSSDSRLGEPKFIHDATMHAIAQYKLNAHEVSVSGLSAGAAMSVIMGVTYPDLFSCVGVGAGLEYQAATSMMSAFTAMTMYAEGFFLKLV